MKPLIVLVPLLLLIGCKNASDQAKTPALQPGQIDPAAPVTQFPTFSAMTLTKSELRPMAKAITETLTATCSVQGEYSYKNADAAYAEVQAFLDKHGWQAVTAMYDDNKKPLPIWIAGQVDNNIPHQSPDKVIDNRMFGWWVTDTDRSGTLSLCIFNSFSEPKYKVMLVNGAGAVIPIGK